MYKSKQSHGISIRVIIVLMLVAGRSASAQANYHVSLDTSSLSASIHNLFALDFQFNDGGTLNNNTVTLSNFMFGGGTAATNPSSIAGGAIGNVNTSVTISDSAIFNELVQSFTPGTSLNFDLSLTTNSNPDAGSFPDQFSFALLDNNGNEIPTTSGNNAFVTIDDVLPNPIVTTAGTPDGATFNIPVPNVTVKAVPETSTFFGLVGGFVFFCSWRIINLRRTLRQTIENCVNNC